MKIKIIAALVLLLVLGGMAYAINDLRHDKAELVKANKTLTDNLAALQKVTEAQRAAILKNQQSERENHDRQIEIRDATFKAPASDDGRVAPVLARALDGLR